MIQIFSKHKFIVLLVLAALGGGGYYSYNRWWKEPEPTRYILARVDRGTLITSVSGSGQVSSSNQVDVKPKASGDLVFLGVANGQAVRAGAIIARIDARDAAKTVRDAEVNLASAKLALEKLKKPADTLTLLQAEHALVQAHEARLKAAEDLRSAEIALEKLKKPADALAILQAENALVTARDTKRKAEEDLTKAYDDGFNTVATAFLDLPSIVAGIRDLLNDTTFERYQSNESWYLNQVIGDTARSKAQQYRTDAIQGYTSAQLLYATNFDTYKATSRLSETTRIEALIGETYVTTKSVADAVKSINNYIDFVKNDMDGRDAAVPAGVTTHLTTLATYTAKTNTQLTSLLNIINTIKNNRDTMVSSDRTIAEKTESLAKLKAGAEPLDIQAQELVVKQRGDAIAAANRAIAEKTESLAKLKAGAEPLDIESQELQVQQRENALRDAREKLVDYTIVTPFAGVIAAVPVKRGEAVSSGTVLATLVTGRNIAEVSLNEVDVAKVSIGQRATVTFDALPGLSITGEVAEIDTVGTVSQGVVTYTVKVAFDTQDDRVKTAMSVTAVIVTEVKTDVLRVPNAAVKTQGDASFVEVAESVDVSALSASANAGIVLSSQPRRRAVGVGLVNDEFSEITDGVTVDDVVVVRTVQPTSSQPVAQQNSLFRLPGGGGGGGGGGRPSGGGGGQQQRR